MGVVKKVAGRQIVGGDAFTIQLQVNGNLATGDGKAFFVVPFDLTIIHAQMELKTTGDTSGNTDVILSAGAVDLNAAAGGRIAYNASAKYLVMTLTTTTLDAGDVLEIDIDAIPGGTTSTELTVTLFVERRVDR